MHVRYVLETEARHHTGPSSLYVGISTSDSLKVFQLLAFDLRRPLHGPATRSASRIRSRHRTISILDLGRTPSEVLETSVQPEVLARHGRRTMMQLGPDYVRDSRRRDPAEGRDLRARRSRMLLEEQESVCG